jgi:hypothetical protein
MYAVNLVKMVEKNEDYWSVRGAKYLEMWEEEKENEMCRGSGARLRVHIGHRPFSTGSLPEPVLKVKPWPHHRLESGLKPFNTGSCYQPVLKVHNEPVLMSHARNRY